MRFKKTKKVIKCLMKTSIRMEEMLEKEKQSRRTLTISHSSMKRTKKRPLLKEIIIKNRMRIKMKAHEQINQPKR